MYYETRTHSKRNVANATEAAKIIKAEQAQSYEALQWQNENGTFFAVSDAHINDSDFAETAMLFEKDGKYFQIESITAGWVESVDELAQIFISSEKHFFVKQKTHLIFDAPKGHEKAQFTCGCCGEWFVGNVQHQLNYNQDTGYGFCPSCEKFYN
jgi:hypothetical protein